MYDQKFPVAKEQLPVQLPFNSVIFVMEDIDAQSPIVRCRQRAAEKARRRRQSRAKATMKAAKVNG